MASTLYVTEQGAVLCRTGERLLVKKNGTVLADLPALQVEQVVIYGNAQVTTQAVAFLLERGIDTVFLSSHGTFRGRLQAECSKNVALRRKQFEMGTHPTFRLELARQFIVGKLRNSAGVCRRHPEARIGRQIDELRQLARQAASARDLEQLRGYEGVATRRYFEALGRIIRSPWTFAGRVKRPPTDPVNVLLSLGYTLLFKDMYALVHLVGFDPFQGFFHEAHFGHPALVSDLIEEFRAPLVDRLVLRLLHTRILRPRHFVGQGERIRLTREGLTRVVTQYRAQRDRRITHRRSGRRLTLYQCMEEQVRQLARVVLGTETSYHPFLME